ncbi:MAG: tRNA (5-methylaminomethyl-2-thiouridylate)-methyltransferase [Anaerolineae bacterium]
MPALAKVKHTLRPPGRQARPPISTRPPAAIRAAGTRGPDSADVLTARRAYGILSAMDQKRNIKAVGMLSGGLDSTLATRILMDQGIDVTPLHIRTGLTYARRERLTGRGPASPSRAEQAAQMLGLELVTIDVFEAYIPVILNPRHGYGSGMNPCTDCRIFLLRQAKTWMEENDHHFIFTGEVLGQRPNSQMRSSLQAVERESGLEGMLLRPLSAKLLEPTIPEKRGWVDRERLYGISGRSRKPQIALAERLGITEYAQPAGGSCFLVDESYSRRLRDFLDHEGPQALNSERAFLLAVGRHLRLPSGTRVIVGRHEEENGFIATQHAHGVLVTTIDETGPMALVLGDPTAEEIEQAGRITARYSSARDKMTVRIEVRDQRQGTGIPQVLTVAPMELEEIHEMMVSGGR